MTFDGFMLVPFAAMLAPNDPLRRTVEHHFVCRQYWCIQIDDGVIGDGNFHAPLLDYDANGPLENRPYCLACFAFPTVPVPPFPVAPFSVPLVLEPPVLSSPRIDTLLKNLPSPTPKFVQATLSWVCSFRLATLVQLVKRLPDT
jgi:hypothetical protein